MTDSPEVVFEPLYLDVAAPCRATDGSAGYEAQVRIRSSVAFKKGLTIPNAPATIDADFPDEWMVIVHNAIAAPVRVEHGERIAQIVLSRFEVCPWVPGQVVVTTRSGGVGWEAPVGSSSRSRASSEGEEPGRRGGARGARGAAASGMVTAAKEGAASRV
ncbi:MAG: dUTP diphosphatase [Gemmatimonadaceae bacterium]